MNLTSKIFVAGHRGLVGSAICRALKKQGFENVVTVEREEVDLTDPVGVRWFFSVHEPDYVFLCAAKVGGIMANKTYPVEFLRQNLAIQDNVISESHRHGVRKLLFLGSACAYPKFAENPVREQALLTGEMEPTNLPYALAKIAGIVLCQSCFREYGSCFISAMPTNLYGPGDHYDLEDSHVLPGMMRRIYEAKRVGLDQVHLWGTGSPVREFLFSDDLANACLLLMDKYDRPELINLGSQRDRICLRDLAKMISEVVEYRGEVLWDSSKPDGTPVRELDGSRMRWLGWEPKTRLAEGVRIVYEDFLERVNRGEKL